MLKINLQVFDSNGTLTPYGIELQQHIDEVLDKVYEVTLNRNVNPREVQALINKVNADLAEQAAVYNYDYSTSKKV